jgi:NADPH:quinone reductase-like Zn-dependent oxidoreductase
MQKIVLDAPGPLTDNARLVDVPTRAPGEGEVIVDIDAANINPADALYTIGWYAFPPVAGADLGNEGTGHVTAVGPGVDKSVLGQRVIILPVGEQGSWAEQVVVARRNLVVVPEGDPLQLAQLAVNPVTAYSMLNDYADLKPGDWIALTLAGSAVGRYVVQLARRAGLRTLGIVRTEEAADRVRADGADAVLVHGDDLAGRVASALDGQELRLVLDGEGGATPAALAASLGHGGTVVAYSAATGEPQHVLPPDLMFRDVRVRGFWIVNWIRDTPRPRLEQVYAELAGLIADGSLRGEVERAYPLPEYKQAFAHAGQPGRTGKILLRVDHG